MSEPRAVYSDYYNAHSIQKPLSIVLSKEALNRLHDKAKTMGIKRNDLVRQVLYNVAFKEDLEPTR